MLDGSQLRDRDLPFGEDLQQQRFESLIHLVDLVDQQYTRLLVEQGSKQRALNEEIQGMQTVPDRIPVLLQPIRLHLQEQLLKGGVELADRLLFVDAFIALQPFDDGVPGRRDRLGQSGLAAARRTLDNDRLLHPRRQEHHLKRDGVDDVLRRHQTLAEIFDRREHAFPLARFYGERSFCPYSRSAATSRLGLI